MSDVVVPLFEVDNGLADALAERGVVFPFAGFAPGRYTQTCLTCRKRHTASKQSTNCLPCAVALAVKVALRKTDDKTKTFAAGRQSGLDDLERFIRSGARSWSPYRVEVPVSPPSPRESAEPPGIPVRADWREESKRLFGVPPEAREYAKAQRDAAEERDDDPEGGAA